MKRGSSRGPGSFLRRRRREGGGRLAGLVWSLHEERPDGPRGLARTGLLLLAALEVGILAWLLTAPALQLHRVDVTGAAHTGSARVLADAGLRAGVPTLSIDAATIRRKLLADPWVRDASVTAQLPDRVVISVSEWQPVAVYSAGASGRPQFINSQAAVLGAAAATDPGLRLTGPPGPDPKPGQRPVETKMLTALVNIARSLPGLIGQQATGFDVDACGNVTMTGGRGWHAIFGRLITPDEYAALPAKLAALKAIASDVNYNNPDLDYVNLENPALPAVKYRSAKPPPPPPSPSPVPSARPSGGPIAIGTPTGLAPVVPCR